MNRPHSADPRNTQKLNNYPKNQTHKKDKYSFNQSPRFLNLNANTLQCIEGSSKKVDYHKKLNTSVDSNVWNNLFIRTYNSEHKKPKIPSQKNKSNITENVCLKNNCKRRVFLNEFDKNLEKGSLKVDDPTVEKLKKTIFTNYSNQVDFENINYRRNFNTENRQEFVSYPNQNKQFSHLLLEYKLGDFESTNKGNNIKPKDVPHKIGKQLFGKRPDYIRDLNKTTFSIFTTFKE